MDFTQPQTQSYPIELLTQQFQIAGQFTPLGDPLSFVNDPQRSVLIIDQADLTPLQPGWRAGKVSRPRVVIPKSEVHLLLVGDLDLESFRLLPRIERLVVYTDTYVANGHFHTGSETQVPDIFHVSPGPYFPATNAEVYSIVAVTTPVAGAAPIVLVNREQVRLFHESG